MPYAINKKGSKYQVVNTSSGEVKAASTSRAKAERARQVLNSLENGWTEVEPGVYKKGGQTITVTGGKK
jgi:hypothetical protein